MTDNGPSRPTFGILHLGELGTALAKVLLADEADVVTTLQNRSESTRRRCEESQVVCLPTIEDVVQAADIVFSVVPTSVAGRVAKEYVACAAKRDKRAVYVDLNSVGPETVVDLEKAIVATGHGFVDAAVHGLASNLSQGAVIYVSGSDSDYVAAQLPKSVRVRRIDGRAGSAATFKMLLAGLNKGLVAHFLELCLAAREADLLSEFTERCYEYYPGVMDVTDRLLPTLRRHAKRRADEMNELERTIELLGIRPGFAYEIRRCFERISDASEFTNETNSSQSSLLQALDWLASADDQLEPTISIKANDRHSH